MFREVEVTQSNIDLSHISNKHLKVILNNVSEITRTKFNRNIEKIFFFDLTNTLIKIGNNFMSECYELTSIELPQNITQIGVNFMSDCGELISIELPQNITQIGDNFMRDCHKIKSIKLPQNITQIGEKFMIDCNELSLIELPQNITQINDFFMFGCSSLKSIELPKNITQIGDFFMRDCSELISIILPKNLIQIGNFFLANCNGIKSIVLPHTLINIGSNFLNSDNPIYIKCNDRVKNMLVSQGIYRESLIISNSSTYEELLREQLQEELQKKREEQLKIQQAKELIMSQIKQQQEQHEKYMKQKEEEKKKQRQLQILHQEQRQEYEQLLQQEQQQMQHILQLQQQQHYELEDLQDYIYKWENGLTRTIGTDGDMENLVPKLLLKHEDQRNLLRQQHKTIAINKQIKSQKYIIESDNSDIIVDFVVDNTIPLEFMAKTDLLVRELNLSLNISKSGYWIFAQKDGELRENRLADEDEFKIFIKAKGKYILYFFHIICTLLQDHMDSCKIIDDNGLFGKRAGHKKFVSYYEINDPTIVVYFLNSTKKEKNTPRGKLYVYKEAQEKMISFIEKLNEIIEYDFNEYCKKEYKNVYRYRKIENSSDTFIDYLQPKNQEGPAFTKKFNELINYCQGGYTETKKNVLMNKLGHNYFTGDITEISIKNNANVLVEFMEKFDGEYFYKSKNTYDILNNYQFKKAIEETKNLEFKMNELLWTHNRTIDIFKNQINGIYGDKNSLIGKYRFGLNFRYGLDSQYGSVVFIMNPTFYDDINEDIFRLTDESTPNKKVLTNLISSENSGIHNYINMSKNKNQLLFENNMKLKINSYITNFRNEVISDNPLCDNTPNLIKNNIDNITKHILSSDRCIQDSLIIGNLVGNNNLLNKHLIESEIIEGAKSQKTWCNYQIQLFDNFEVKTYVYKILIPSNIDHDTKLKISENPIYSSKVVYIDAKGENFQEKIQEPEFTPEFYKYRRKDGNSSNFTFFPEDFKKFEIEYYKIIDELIQSNKMIGGNYKQKYKKYRKKL
jgi:hypothetical protein